jgi:hypothetical protein
VEVDQIAEGLWRWTTRHPEWDPGEDWPADVGCVYYEVENGVVLIDPLVPQEEDGRERFLRALDRDVENAGGRVRVLRTVRWHHRSVDEVCERYGATLSTEAPGIEAFEIEPAEESVFWLAEHRAVVPGDAIIGADDGGVQMCPQSWLGERTHDELRSALRPLLDLPVERVLVSHGEPVLERGREALAKALGP